MAAAPFHPMDVAGPLLASPHTQTRDAKHWNSMIRFQTRQKNDRAILQLFTEMEAMGFLPDTSTMPLVLKSCARLEAVEEGKKIHSLIRGTPFIHDVRIRTALIDFYCKCGFLREASHLFDEMPERDLVSWNAMICGYVANSLYEDAIALSVKLQKANLKPNSVTVVGLLSACTELSDYRMGLEIHCYCLRNAYFDSSAHAGTSLIGFYAKFSTKLSRSVFDSMTSRNLVSWNAMLSGYYNAGEVSEALLLFTHLLLAGERPCSVTMLITIQCCADLGSPELAAQVHQFSVKCGLAADEYAENALMNMYAKCETLTSSVKLFERMHTRDVASWNAMLFAYKISGHHEEALCLFSKMQLEEVERDMVTFATALLICGESSSLDNAKALHACVLKNGFQLSTSIGNALLSTYANFNCVDIVNNVFSEMTQLDVVSWNTLISALINNQFISQAWECFGHMREFEVKPNSFTMVALLAGCCNENYLNIGRSIHGYVIRQGLELNSSLNSAVTEMYINSGSETKGRFLFDNFSDKDLISWNSIIASYVHNGQAAAALSLFHGMHLFLKPNPATMVNILPACASLAHLMLGRALHAYIIRRELSSNSDISIENALIMVYSKCGSIRRAEKIFQNLQKRDIVSWNSMIAGYGMHGRAQDALDLFAQMQSGGPRPTSVTFVSVLSACSHSGLVDEGWELFHSMARDYDITPETVHYACIVDLLARAGHLDEAKSFIDLMPVAADPCAWRALLGACRVYRNLEVARSVSKKLQELEPMNIGNYILLSNVYAAVGNWNEMQRLRLQIKDMGLRKAPGVSWIVIDNQLLSFRARDISHPEAENIYKKLNFLTTQMVEHGHVPDESWIFHDFEDCG